MMINEFSRTEMLIGTEGMNKLKNSTVAVFGVGGVGSHAVEALARCGVGRLILVDNDTVSLTNINRQSIALHSTMGQFKTRVMKDKIADICPGTQVITFEEFVLPDNIESLFERMKHQMGQGSSVDYILDAIDTVTAKLALAGFAASHAVPVIASMGTGNKLDASAFEVADITKTSMCPLARVMRRELSKRGIRHLKVVYSKEEAISPTGWEAEAAALGKRQIPGSSAFVPGTAGLILAGEVVRDIASGAPEI